jgi:hypothetical protein
MIKQLSLRFHVERLNLKKLNEVEDKESTTMRFQIGLHLWKIWTQSWKFIMFRKRIEGISKFPPKTVYVIANRRSISHGTTKDAQNY